MTGHPRYRRQHRTLSGRKQASRGPPSIAVRPLHADREPIGLGPGPAQQESIPARVAPEPAGSAPPSTSPLGGLTAALGPRANSVSYERYRWRQ